MTLSDSETATRLHYSRSRRRLELSFGDGADFGLSAEFLRVFSPSAEVRGHGPGRKHRRPASSSVSCHQSGRALCGANHFDDGTTPACIAGDICDLAEHQDQYWQRYLQQLWRRKSRDPEIQVSTLRPDQRSSNRSSAPR